ncbi:MAG: hypothetical protein M1269_03745 [Chloroflexi bacterium]|nr:hypothetical protein [Chloroflexota bacterium]
MEKCSPKKFLEIAQDAADITIHSPAYPTRFPAKEVIIAVFVIVSPSTSG